LARPAPAKLRGAGQPRSTRPPPLLPRGGLRQAADGQRRRLASARPRRTLPVEALPLPLSAESPSYGRSSQTERDGGRARQWPWWPCSSRGHAVGMSFHKALVPTLEIVAARSQGDRRVPRLPHRSGRLRRGHVDRRLTRQDYPCVATVRPARVSAWQRSCTRRPSSYVVSATNLAPLLEGLHG
jgi:hypothetical protein